MSEVVVTGSRVIRNGFQAPTPVTRLTSEALTQLAPTDIADALNELPQFRGSSSNTKRDTYSANNFSQGNYLNLRGLGTQRSLVLLDSVRVPPTSVNGGVDVNTLPQLLVQRVDVVTGGASAAYGSDAVVGVVNFVLDKNFNGLKAVAQGGMSRYGDSNFYRLQLAGGTPFLAGRGHIEFSAEHFSEGGLRQDQQDRYSADYLFVGSATKALPLTTVAGARFNTVTYGGLITSGPLTGQRFLPGGTLTQANFGAPTTSNNITISGDGATFSGTTLTAPLRTDQLFSRASFDLTSTVNAHIQGSFGESRDRFFNGEDVRQPGDPVNSLTIFSGNAFLNLAV